MKKCRTLEVSFSGVFWVYLAILFLFFLVLSKRQQLDDVQVESNDLGVHPATSFLLLRSQYPYHEIR